MGREDGDKYMLRESLNEYYILILSVNDLKYLNRHFQNNILSSQYDNTPVAGEARSGNVVRDKHTLRELLEDNLFTILKL